ncbi:MAG: hypothetical protein A2W90_00385 [Bacteroidetes bacterium GWF2_42_66]|nr:MAG: hypothetical protein A2W92_18930 [Bacteroidetes bacterium GWA2_42_15]OFY02081.1 MAG: hypothetical protein A2W89_11575 [Bacteroidetes bacterium GWE2_42_39]OFY43427.1 MAG: hypothetical protein A2W90_00385 [Bacteroidetes bacterium GWF2_42_66]HBL76512.1 hypothetical protein [Prolixibacteraceae bacterium]HCU63807.1 hypothetical protein [Prolixibacteraceae bacterium]
MKNIYLIVVFQLLLFPACAQEQDMESKEGELIFQSGFEPDSKVIARGSDADITGKDNSFPSHNDWVNDLDNHPDIGNFSLQYQGGDDSQRFAKISTEPGKPANHVLHFWLNEANVEGKKGRIQGNLYGNKGMKEFYQSERIFLTGDFNSVRTFPDKITWLTIAEFWNNITWSPSVPYGFRITLGIGKPVKEESDLYFIIDGQDCQLFDDGSQKYTTLWSDTNNKVKVPIEKWFTLEYYYKEGNAENGKFYMTIQPDGGQKEVIFDLTRITHSTKDPNPDGVTDFNPIKLYTSKTLIDYMRNQGKTLQIYWDDFKLWKDKRP